MISTRSTMSSYIRLKGDYLEHTGSIAGMSGSPIYITTTPATTACSAGSPTAGR